MDYGWIVDGWMDDGWLGGWFLLIYTLTITISVYVKALTARSMQFRLLQTTLT